MKELFNPEKFILTDEEIKVNDLISDGYFVSQWNDNSSLLGRKKVYRIEKTTVEEKVNQLLGNIIQSQKYSENDMKRYAEFCIICDNNHLSLLGPKDWFNNINSNSSQ